MSSEYFKALHSNTDFLNKRIKITAEQLGLSIRKTVEEQKELTKKYHEDKVGKAVEILTTIKHNPNNPFMKIYEKTVRDKLSKRGK